MRRAIIVLAVALAGGVTAAASLGSQPARPLAGPPTTPTPIAGQPINGCAGVNGTTNLVNPPSYTVVAGSGVRITGCNWFPRTACTNRVHFSLTANDKTYALGGSIAPDSYVGISTSFPYIDPSLSAIDGGVSIPEQVNLGTGPVQAMVTGRQVLDLSLPVLGCFDVVKKSSHPTPVTVLPATSDSSVVTTVQPAEGATVPRGGQLRLAWTLSRAGEVRIHVFFDFTAGRELSVRTGTYPHDSVLDEQRAAGANQLTLPLADAAGNPFPAGKYRFEIELLDPAGSTLIPAKAMTAHFTVITG